MGALIRSEFRKVLTTNVWWALLIPAAIVTMLTVLGGGLLGFIFDSLVAQFEEFSDVSLPVALIAFASGLNIGTIFAAIFGGLSMAGEFQHRTITTTYLTAPNRTATLLAKMAVYGVFGLGYGLVNVVFGTVGALVGQGVDKFPDVGEWLAVSGLGLLVTVLWTLLGVGLGALVRSQIGVVLIVPLSSFVEFLLGAVLSTQNAEEVTAFFPNSSASNALSGLAGQFFLDDLNPGLRSLLNTSQLIAGPAWWLTLLVFVAYAALIVFLGRLASQRRDVA
ncbi:ABC-2 type transport system permease protein [Crossiella equi]|uniref:ABC-2 type transport system permease protein n=1 Tax=Crossiella equi TaxID=130796 RepID=A0ABS5ADU8_9PSEU|nr:hypothetical protein [Crossiella equi]MBP2474501.1 ABC-2 type transport system permease protein [Crossiella equi]